MTIQESLAEAKAAYHELMTGRAVAEFRDQNGETVRYQAANARGLAAYILDLENKISTACRPGAPMQFWGR